MYYKGSFLTRKSEVVTVNIVTHGDRSTLVEIGADNGGLFFSDDPVEITSSVNDTFDHLLRQQASIRLLTREFVPDFFCESCTDATVMIYKGSECVFAGFIEPQAYSQGYNEAFDELELSCVDILTALQYAKYKDVGAFGVVYETVKANAGDKTFFELMEGAFGKIFGTFGDSETWRIFYDGSKAIDDDAANKWSIFDDISISDLLFLGSEEDDVWGQDKVVEALLKYLNLHILQQGTDFYIFSWETVKNGGTIVWHDLRSAATKTTVRDSAEISLDNVASNDTAISVGQVYNQILLTCNIDSVENVVESPLDENALVSPYSNKQLYMTEYSSDGEGVRATNAFYAMTHDEPTDYDAGEITDWYIQVMSHPSWIFPEIGTNEDLIEKYCKNNENQQALPNRFYPWRCCGIFSLGKIVENTSHADNSPMSKLDMTNYLVVSVNGNEKDEEGETVPSPQSLKSRIPLAVYNGGVSGGVYSPADPEATNYIVISGSVILNPIMRFTNDYKTLHNMNSQSFSLLKGPTVYSRTNEDGRYYTQKYYKAETPFDEPEWDEGTARGLVPFTDTGAQLYEFTRSNAGDNTDKISKVPVLACMLVIGDKCVVETGTDGQPSDFEWKTYKERSQCTSDEEYYKQCFTIGFDPKIGDKLIGTEFDMQNNINFKMGIDAEGIAIPIKASDRISGPVRFLILGPTNTIWGKYTIPGWEWYNRTQQGVPLMAHVSNILLKSFEVKIYSDNGLINNLDESDLIYMSDTRENFVNKKDDITFDICSALTLAECQELGIPDAVRLSTPKDKLTGLGVLSIYDRLREQQEKPERLYVNSYYSEYHRPRIEMTVKFEDSAGFGPFSLFEHPAMSGKVFYVQSISRNLIQSYSEITLKEVWND